MFRIVSIILLVIVIGVAAFAKGLLIPKSTSSVKTHTSSSLSDKDKMKKFNF